METLIIYGLLALGGLAFLRALVPMQPTPPQIIYVQVDPQPTRGLGCLLPLVLVVVLVVLLRLFGG